MATRKQFIDAINKWNASFDEKQGNPRTITVDAPTGEYWVANGISFLVGHIYSEWPMASEVYDDLIERMGMGLADKEDDE